MDQKFEATIDLEAQPFTDAVRTAIAGLQALADELSKANSSLNDAAGGMDRSAAAADGVAQSSVSAAAALDSEAKSAKTAAEAHGKHADALRRSSDENRKMREGLLVGSSLLRTASAVASGSGYSKTATGLDIGSSVLNAFAMRAMMGPAGALVGIGEIASKVVPIANEWISDNFAGGKQKKIDAQKLSSDFTMAQVRKQIEDSEKYNQALAVQVGLKNQLEAAEVELKKARTLDIGGDNIENIKSTKKQVDALKELVALSAAKANALKITDTGSMLQAFDDERKKAISDKSYEISLINATDEEKKISVIDQRIKALKAESDTLEGSARVMASKNGDPEKIQKLLNDSKELRSQVDALDVQRSSIRADSKSKSSSGQAPDAFAYNPQVDSFWSRGLMLGGGGGSATVDYQRRAATAAEKTAMNTDRLVAKEGSTGSGTWGNG